MERTYIGNDVWIGCGSMILSGVHVGNGAVIGIGAVVTKNVKPYSIVVGVPAKCLRKRFTDDIIEKVQKLSWWEWDDIKLKSNLEIIKKETCLEDLQYISNNK